MLWYPSSFLPVIAKYVLPQTFLKFHFASKVFHVPKYQKETRILQKWAKFSDRSNFKNFLNKYWCERTATLIKRQIKWRCFSVIFYENFLSSFFVENIRGNFIKAVKIRKCNWELALILKKRKFKWSLAWCYFTMEYIQYDWKQKTFKSNRNLNHIKPFPLINYCLLVLLKYLQN